MDGQMRLFDWLYPDQLNPLREVAKNAGPYWTTSRQKLIDLCNTDPDIDIFAKAVKEEYCPYGLSGHYGGDGKPNTMEGWDMTSGKIMTYFWDAEGLRKERRYSWKDFAIEISDLIWANEYGRES